MAIWGRKDESEWEKYQRLQQKADHERDEPEEKDAAVPLTERLMERLRPAREEEPPAPPERCPWCGGEMEHGYVSFGRDAAVWTAEKPGAFFGTMLAREKIEIGGGLFAPKTVGWFCRSCRKLAMDVPEPPETDDLLSRQTETTEENEE